MDRIRNKMVFSHQLVLDKFCVRLANYPASLDSFVFLIIRMLVVGRVLNWFGFCSKDYTARVLVSQSKLYHHNAVVVKFRF